MRDDGIRIITQTPDNDLNNAVWTTCEECGLGCKNKCHVANVIVDFVPNAKIQEGMQLKYEVVIPTPKHSQSAMDVLAFALMAIARKVPTK